MYAISTYIQLNNIVLNYCESFAIQSTWDAFTDTAEIVVPNVIFRSQTTNESIGLDALLKRGDPVLIKGGYNKSEKDAPIRFKGFISDIETGTILRIKCQDAMYALKQVDVQSRVLKKTTLQGLLDHILQDVNIDLNLSNRVQGSTGIGDWAIENNTFLSPVQVLKKLKSDYGFVSFIRDDKLSVGVPYDDTGVTHYLLKELHFTEPDNLVNEINDTKRVLKGISILPDNTKKIRYAVKENDIITVGSEAIKGELRTLNYYNLTEVELDEVLKTVYQNTNYAGLQGDFTIFGEPFIQHNDWVKIRDLKNPERNGTYKVRGVSTQMTVSGGLRQLVTIDFGISEVEAN